jgi:Tol biopolymer transport system component
VFSSTGGALWEIPVRGGEPRVLLESLEGDAREPHFLPTDAGPEALVYEAGSRIWVLDLETGERSEIGPGSAPVYSPDGYLIHGSGDTGEPGLLALPFSRAGLEPTGEAFPIAEDGQFASVARDGTLVFLDGIRAAVQTLVWRDRAGEVLETIGQPQQGMVRPALAPDGQRIAVRASESGNQDVWIHDLIRSTKTCLTFDERAERTPTWSPSGREVAYWSQDDEGHRLMSTSADGTGEPVVLVESANVLNAPDWSRDGRYLLYYEINPATRHDIRYIELGADGAASEPVTFLDSPAGERDPKLSPNGRFLAYSSDESGSSEIYVRPFPDGAGKWQVSVNGGRYPR